MDEQLKNSLKNAESLVHSELLKRAELLARFVHMGQKRHDGSDYVNNHQAYMVEWIIAKWIKEGVLKDRYSLSDEQVDVLCAIWLHDVFEDCGWQNRIGIHQVVANYFNPTTVHIMAVLTHEKHETYREYFERITEFPLALEVKWADMVSNTSKNTPEKQMKKYQDALIHIISIGKVNVSIIPLTLVTRLHLFEFGMRGKDDKN